LDETQKQKKSHQLQEVIEGEKKKSRWMERMRMSLVFVNKM